MKRSTHIILSSAVLGMVLMAIGTIFGLIQMAKHDAIMHMGVYGAREAYVADIRPSPSHGLWMEIRFSNKDSRVTGMHWYLHPWRDYEIIK